MRVFSYIRVVVCIFVFICAGEMIAWPAWPPNAWELPWWSVLPIAVQPDIQLASWQSQSLATAGVFVCWPPFYLVRHTDIRHHPTYFIYFWIFVAVWLALLFGLIVAIERLFIRKYGKHAA